MDDKKAYKNYQAFQRELFERLLFWEEYQSDTLKDVTSANVTNPNNYDCVDCEDCKNCVGCVNCKNCVGCVDCYNCNGCCNCINCELTDNSKNCYSVKDSDFCHDCTKCESCHYCISCISCEHCKWCDRIQNCNFARKSHDCNGGHHLSFCKNMSNCEFCIDCMDCSKTSRAHCCINCTNCKECYSCTNAVECDTCFRCSSCQGLHLKHDISNDESLPQEKQASQVLPQGESTSITPASPRTDTQIEIVEDKKHPDDKTSPECLIKNHIEKEKSLFTIIAPPTNIPLSFNPEECEYKPMAELIHTLSDYLYKEGTITHSALHHKVSDFISEHHDIPFGLSKPRDIIAYLEKNMLKRKNASLNRTEWAKKGIWCFKTTPIK